MDVFSIEDEFVERDPYKRVVELEHEFLMFREKIVGNINERLLSLSEQVRGIDQRTAIFVPKKIKDGE